MPGSTRLDAWDEESTWNCKWHYQLCMPVSTLLDARDSESVLELQCPARCLILFAMLRSTQAYSAWTPPRYEYPPSLPCSNAGNDGVCTVPGACHTPSLHGQVGLTG
eukprot:361612-Chlamydomonas_euryale.AAC.13